MSTTPLPVSPFEVVEHEGVRVASDGVLVVQSLDLDAQMFRRRGVSGLGGKPAAETALPLVNALAGQLAAATDMPASEVQSRLAAIAAHVEVPPPQQHEWLVVTLGDVHVYVMRGRVIVTRAQLHPGQV